MKTQAATMTGKEVIELLCVNRDRLGVWRNQGTLLPVSPPYRPLVYSTDGVWGYIPGILHQVPLFTLIRPWDAAKIAHVASPALTEWGRRESITLVTLPHAKGSRKSYRYVLAEVRAIAALSPAKMHDRLHLMFFWELLPQNIYDQLRAAVMNKSIPSSPGCSRNNPTIAVADVRRFLVSQLYPGRQTAH